MVTQDHRWTLPKTGDQALSLAKIEGYALIVVIAQMPIELQRMLTYREEPALLAGYGDAVSGMGVHHACQIVPRHVNGRMDREACR